LDSKTGIVSSAGQKFLLIFFFYRQGTYSKHFFYLIKSNSDLSLFCQIKFPGKKFIIDGEGAGKVTVFFSNDDFWLNSFNNRI